jgi:hypothetical protein
VSLNLPKLPKLRAPKKGRGGILDELNDYVTVMTMSSPDRGGLCGRDVKMRTDSLKGQTEDGFSVARDDHWSKSKQEHIHHHRKYRLINADPVASFR